MPVFPVPPIAGGVPVDTAALPVSTVDDVATQWAPEIQAVEEAPIRDAIEEGQLALLLEYQRRSRYAAAQSDPLRATGEYQDEILGFERGLPRQANEQDPAYSLRGNAFQKVVDPNDIIAAANAVLAPYTTISARYFEHSDACFLQDGTATWFCALYQGTGNQPPDYPDRNYDKIPIRRPGGARIFSDVYGRYFALILPDLSALDSKVNALTDGLPTEPANEGVFLGVPGGTSDLNASFLWSVVATSFDVYNAVASAVNAIVGQSIRWAIFVDSQLTS